MKYEIHPWNHSQYLAIAGGKSKVFQTRRQALMWLLEQEA